MLRAMILEAAIGLTGAASASAGNYKVMITTWHGCEEARQGFQDYLKEPGVGTDIILRDADQAKEALPGILAEARSENIDLSLSWGTSVTLGIGGTFSQLDDPAHYHEIPEIFMIVADPVGAGIVDSLQHTGSPNLTWEKIGQGFDADGVTVDSENGLQDALSGALKSGRTTLIGARIDGSGYVDQFNALREL